MSDLAPIEVIGGKILVIRGRKVMLDRDLAALYGVSAKYLKRQVRRNINRFPDDFMFELSGEELQIWRSQFGASNSEKMGLRHKPFAFTEQGVAMLSSVLSSERAVQINIRIIRVFVRLREIFAAHKDLQRKVEEHDGQKNNSPFIKRGVPMLHRGGVLNNYLDVARSF